MKKLSNNNLWWLDYSILNTNSVNFKFSKYNNTFYLKLTNYFYFFILNKNNLNNLYFYILDNVLISNNNIKNYYLSYQSIFFDFKILINTEITDNLQSLTSIYAGLSWPERECKEFNNINFFNLNDTRKLLSNYNYNTNLNYNNFNNIINDIQV
jgi:Ni,Fe-hydrogenase III component G